ncbi:family 78 glycoside hydrolase catalytic domain [Paenibacillus sp. HN-1]|uniref:alpha-L-rhamnosidase n=1 Tax=Paenibacillus TaxID=44249 RepID=UPI001CA980B2|nr:MULTISPECIES: alpha-L-rhamnosidase [Paenibacillus]MBY9078350.1 family 78 glycoside hydrolase catalytic domain [Paenibacillus sp. CGMCC 1.18879]MBY9083162.1 family 78 glycoside hydrolase catalytic domain [Paenibacillus sinensis]
MKIIRLKTNRVTNPLGFDLGKPRFSYVVIETEAKKQTAARYVVAIDQKFEDIVFDSGRREDISSLAFELPIELMPRTRYFWRVEVWADNGEQAISEPAWFETAKLNEPWMGKWITPEWDTDIHPVLKNSFQLNKAVASARVYICGLGLYEMCINGVKAGNEFLTPNFNNYHKWLQYQTYEVTGLLRSDNNEISVSLGNGLYKGRFGFDGHSSELYGNKFALLCEVVVTYRDGTTDIFVSDTSWTAVQSQIQSGNLYDGEVYDATFQSAETYSVREIDLGYDRLKARLSLPVIVKEKRKPLEVILTPAGETVLDMGQNMVGWIEYRTTAPRGTLIRLQFGEVLQNGNFYRENLRTARAEHQYTADGRETMVRPHFTYYGFRYVKVEGWTGELSTDDFTGCVLYSDLEDTGYIETSNPLVNRLFLNAKWGQKGNFLDVPTDCPQRDERLGWTGDAQVFSGTACFNMDSYAFFNKYCYDIGTEQEERDGEVPMVVPAANVHEGGSSAWGDAAAIIPWNMYIHYGDIAILQQQFDSMKGWVDYIIRADADSGGRRLWTTGFHFGDWLSLDSSNPDSPFGGTDKDFIASAYYCYSANIVAKAAKVLGKAAEAVYYEHISQEVKAAIQNEYFTQTGRLAVDTQTAYALALFMELIPEGYEDKAAEALRKRLKADRNHLKTGFVGTPYLNHVLTQNGGNDLAYTLLLNDDYPSWLYAVKLGATTIWERWNSILPDGTISDTGMNSLNHYAYGAIIEWMYRCVAGINPIAEAPGFRQVELAPKPDARLGWAKATVESAAGTYRSGWDITREGYLRFEFEIPFNASAQVRLPHAQIKELVINGHPWELASIHGEQSGEEVHLDLLSGNYLICYPPTKRYLSEFSTKTPLIELLRHDEAASLIRTWMSEQAGVNPDDLGASLGVSSLRDLAAIYRIPSEILDQMDEQLSHIK